MSGDVLDVYFNNLTVRFGGGTMPVPSNPSPMHISSCASCGVQLNGTDRGVRIKSQAGRGGVVANVTYANMRVYNVAEGRVGLKLLVAGARFSLCSADGVQ
jgi:polygalacturonase